MPSVTFKPQGFTAEVQPNTKLLAAATRHKIPIRFGCASCRCGTCGVRVEPGDGLEMTPMKADEQELLSRMKLPLDGSVRLACQARILAGSVGVDLDFQDSYSPDQGDEYAEDDDEEE